MKLECVRAFGNFVPGDEVEVPDGAIFDTTHFTEAKARKVTAKKDDDAN